MGAGRFGAWLILQNGVARRFLSRRFRKGRRNGARESRRGLVPLAAMRATL